LGCRWLAVEFNSNSFINETWQGSTKHHCFMREVKSVGRWFGLATRAMRVTDGGAWGGSAPGCSGGSSKCTEEGDAPWVGQSWAARPERLRPGAKISKEMIWAVKVNRAEIKN
jgi:hypothetical protein